MPVRIGYAASSSAEIPVIVSYKCAICGKENVDTSQKIKIIGTSSGSLFAFKQELMEKSRENLSDNIAIVKSAIEYGDYEPLHLKCVCASCGQRQVWSSYPNSQYWFVAGGIALFLAVVMFIPVLNGGAPEALRFALPLLLAGIGCIAYPKLMVKRIHEKLAALSEACKPRILSAPGQGDKA